MLHMYMHMYIHICVYLCLYEDCKWNPPNTVWKGEERQREWEYNGGGELVQSTLFSCMELSQWNPLVLFMYTNTKI
jgi:hypothetical protein